MCFTTCWQERVKKRGKPFTSRSLKSTITSVRWDLCSQTLFILSSLFARFCPTLVFCMCFYVIVEFYVMRSDLFAIVSYRPVCICVCLCVSVLWWSASQPRTVVSVSLNSEEREIRTQRKHIPLWVAFNTCCVVCLCHRHTHTDTHTYDLSLSDLSLRRFYFKHLCVFMFIWLCFHVCFVGVAACVWVSRTLWSSFTFDTCTHTSSHHRRQTHAETQLKTKTAFVTCLCCLCCPQWKQVPRNHEGKPH